MAVHLLGIRHHGPGSARSVERALGETMPDVLLVELPADCQPLLQWVSAERLVPPVAILGVAVDKPQRAAFLPFASFSPEWVAVQWAVAHQVPVRAFDLPLAYSLVAYDETLNLERRPPIDPIGELAAVAGDPDAERWWEDVVEHRGEGMAGIAAVAEAMHAVRHTREATSDGEARREAWMRRAIRTAQAEGFEQIAVVCGAWHVPALTEPFLPAAADARTLRGLSKAKVHLSWVPWTYRRLATDSGYRSGVPSPAWYEHVYRGGGTARWFVAAAQLLRERGIAVSPDHVMAATRHADTLATMRDRPRPGLQEMLDAVSAVLADSGGVTLVHDELVVGTAIGRVPDDAPQVPLARDLAAQQRAARLKPAATAQVVELDLRTPNGQRRSVLLHRLRALDVPWGQLQAGRGSSGTFRETWRVAWEPEWSVRLVERSALGTTVESAAAARLRERARGAASLADIIGVLDVALLAELPSVIAPAVAALQGLAAVDSDVCALLDALSPLANTLRYGNVRGSDAATVSEVFDGLVVRMLAGVVTACRSLDDAAANAMVERLTAANGALAIVDHQTRRVEWPAALAVLADRRDIPGVVQGRAARLLHDLGEWSAERLGARISRSLSGGTPPKVGAAFVEGFLAGSGTVLLHDRALLQLVDDWVADLAPEAFVDTIPLLRRTFGAFEPAERRQLGALVADGLTAPTGRFADDVDEGRALTVMHTVRQLLGVPS
jgi:hypothetical protein